MATMAFTVVSAFFVSMVHAETIVKSIDNLQNVETHEKGQSIALTLDACGGKTDWNILHFLVDNDIPATIFVTEKWIDANPEAVTYIREHNTVFKVENHGKEHREAVYREVGAYHLPATVNDQGMQKEVEEGEAAIERAFGVKATWYRDAGALYDSESINWLHSHNWQIAGYTIAGDEGATASTPRILMLLSKAKPGDVILMHMNKPQGHTFEGMHTGILKLKEEGMKFAWLEE